MRTRHHLPTAHDDFEPFLAGDLSALPGTRLTASELRLLCHLPAQDCERIVDYLGGDGYEPVEDEDTICREDW